MPRRNRAANSIPIFPLFALFFCGSLAIFLSSSRGPTGTFLEHDNFALAYPARVLVSTAQNAGIPALWDHWSHGGVPLNTLFMPYPESPVIRCVGFFGIYTPSLFTAEITIYFFLCFLGTFLWLRFYGTPLMAIMGAAAFSLSGYFIYQAPINIEGLAGPCLYPLLLWGFRLCFAEQEAGAAVVAVAAWIMLTTGYLGTNIVALQLLPLFSFGEWSLTRRDKGKALLPQLRRPAIYLALSGLLVTALLSFPIAESYSFFRFDFGQIREAGFSPLTASAAVQSLGTLAFPNLVSPFVPDASDGHIGFIFLGLISLFFVLFGLRNKDQRPLKTYLLLFSIFVFCANQSDRFGFGGVFMRLIPFYKQVRFHVWNMILALLFLVPLAMLGLRDFFETSASPSQLRKESALAASATAAIAAISLLLVDAHPARVAGRGVFQCGQIYAFALFLAGLPFLISLRRIRPQAALLLVGALMMGEFYVMRADHVHLGMEYAGQERRESEKTDRFAPGVNERTILTEANSEYFDKQIAFQAYNPLVLPAYKKLLDEKKGDARKYFHYVFYPASLLAATAPAAPRVGFEAADTKSLRVVIRNDGTEPEPFIWSSPFSRNWKLKIDHQDSVLAPTAEGLSLFAAPPGTSTVELEYAPSYYLFCRVLKWGAMIALLLISLRAAIRIRGD